jgi:hypothetical protein
MYIEVTAAIGNLMAFSFPGSATNMQTEACGVPASVATNECASKGKNRKGIIFVISIT